MKITIDSLDKLFSECVRRRAILTSGGCERCLRPKIDSQKENGEILPAWMKLQCSHFHGRSAKSTRWDLDNAAGLCGKCHIDFGGQPEEHRIFFVNRLGQERYDLLLARKRVPARYIDRSAIMLYLKDEIGKMKDGAGQ